MKKIITCSICLLFFYITNAQDSLAYKIAANAYGNRQFEDAVYWFSKSIEKKYKLAESYLYRGMAKVFLQKFDEGKADLLYSYKLDSSSSMTSFTIGSFYYEKGFLDSSIIWFDKAIQKDAKDPDFYNSRAAVYLDKNDPDKALADVNIAVSLSPNNIKPLYLRGYIKQQQSDLEGALVDYNSVLKIDPSMENNYFTYVGISYCHFNLGDTEKGISEVSEVLSRYPRLPYALLIRGQMYKGMGDKEKACADAMVLKSVDPAIAKEYFESYCE